jgi:predicted RNA-binding Zn ribbon-like protein
MVTKADINRLDKTAKATQSTEITREEASELISARAQLRDARDALTQGDEAQAQHMYETAKGTINSIP